MSSEAATAAGAVGDQKPNLGSAGRLAGGGGAGKAVAAPIGVDATAHVHSD